MHPISLHQLTVADAHPRDLIRLASALGCQHVCLFTQGIGDAFPFPIVQDHEVAELRELMDGLGITVLSTTTFPLTPSLAVDSYLAGLERSAQLGSRMANVRFVDEDETRLADNFARLTDLAARHDIELTVEFTAFRKEDPLGQALDVIGHAGRGKLCLDALHIMRTGTPLDALRQLDPDLIGCFQFCDGPLDVKVESAAREGAFDRMPPGEGEFPLLELLALVPEGMPISVEAPQDPARLAGVSATERGRRAVMGMRDLISLSERR